MAPEVIKGSFLNVRPSASADGNKLAYMVSTRYRVETALKKTGKTTLSGRGFPKSEIAPYPMDPDSRVAYEPERMVKFLSWWHLLVMGKRRTDDSQYQPGSMSTWSNRSTLTCCTEYSRTFETPSSAPPGTRYNLVLVKRKATTRYQSGSATKLLECSPTRW